MLIMNTPDIDIWIWNGPHPQLSLLAIQCTCNVSKNEWSEIAGFSKKSDEFIIHVFQDVSLLRK